jgi:hypothetical protein
MFYDLNTAVNNELIEVPSQPLISEMRRYDKEDLRIKNYDDEATEHFDLLVALAIGFQMKDFSEDLNSIKTFIPDDL